jgi:hypothetical protein
MFQVFQVLKPCRNCASEVVAGQVNISYSAKVGKIRWDATLQIVIEEEE